MPDFLDPDQQQNSAYCYQITIDLTQININDVDFQYTEYGSYYTTTVSAQNWPQLQSSSGVVLVVCSASPIQILIAGQTVFSPSDYGISITGGFQSCLDHNSCSFGQTAVDCELSEWGYGEPQDSWVAGAFSPCILTQGSYQQFQTRYVITPAQNGGSCNGATIQYTSCTPPQLGTGATLSTPTFTQITSTSLIASTTVLDNGGSDIISVAFNISINSTLLETLTLTDFTLGTFVEFTGLTASTQYTITAIARNSQGFGTPSTGTVSTISPASISTPTISSITDSSASSTATFTNNSGTPYSSYGIIYKIGNADNLTVGSPGVAQIETGALAQQSPTQLVSQLTGLNRSTQYYVRAYVQGATVQDTDYLYSSTANFTIADPPQGVNLAQLGITSVALAESVGLDEAYRFITNPTATQNRSYVSTITPLPDDPFPGVYRITTNFQQVNLNSLRWVVQVKSSPGQPEWQPISIVNLSTELAAIRPISGWTYYQYNTGLTHVDFRPFLPGYYNFLVSGNFIDGSPFTINREIIIGNAPTDLEIVSSELRQGALSRIQVVTLPSSPEWIPEFPQDSMFGLAISQTGSTITPSLTINNITKAFTAVWGINPANERLTPTLQITLTSPFKNRQLLNTFEKGFTLAVLPAIPIITFSNPAMFNSPLTSGTGVTISVSTQHVKGYVITSSLGNGSPNSPVTYSTVQPGTYTITATATNDTAPNLQTAVVTGTLTVAAAAPIISQLPQQTSGRNRFIDINTLPFVNLNGAAFSNLVIVNQPSNGAVTRTNYTIRYIPTADYTGTDLFSFRVNSLTGTQSNIVNVSVLVAAPSFSVGSGNATISLNSTEIGLTRDIVVPIVNTGTIGLTINTINIEQFGEDFKLMIPGAGNIQVSAAAIQNIEIPPTTAYNVTIRVEPTAIGVRTAKLKINHN